jgi:hypothetical protein
MPTGLLALLSHAGLLGPSVSRPTRPSSALLTLGLSPPRAAQPAAGPPEMRGMLRALLIMLLLLWASLLAYATCTPLPAIPAPVRSTLHAKALGTTHRASAAIQTPVRSQTHAAAFVKAHHASAVIPTLARSQLGATKLGSIPPSSTAVRGPATSTVGATKFDSRDGLRRCTKRLGRYFAPRSSAVHNALRRRPKSSPCAESR